jgi:hypothetical protein
VDFAIARRLNSGTRQKAEIVANEWPLLLLISYHRHGFAAAKISAGTLAAPRTNGRQLLRRDKSRHNS